MFSQQNTPLWFFEFFNYISCLKRWVVSCRIWIIVIQLNYGTNKSWKVNNDFNGALQTVNVNVKRSVKWGWFLKKLLNKCSGWDNLALSRSSSTPTVVEVRLLDEVALLLTKTKQSWCLWTSLDVYRKMRVKQTILCTPRLCMIKDKENLSWRLGLAIKASEHM